MTDREPRRVLERAREHTRDGRYADALADFLWFHRHALEHDPAYYGVRLSFALAFWNELARVYPRAGEVLLAVRNEAAEAALRGEGDARELFNDACAIDLEMGRTLDTYALFMALRAQRPAVASSCEDIALPCIVDAGDWALALQLMGHPEDYLLDAGARLDDYLAMKAPSRATAKLHRETLVNIYCEEVSLLVRVLEGAQRPEWAAAARLWAVALAGRVNAGAAAEILFGASR